MFSLLRCPEKGVTSVAVLPKVYKFNLSLRKRQLLGTTSSKKYLTSPFDKCRKRHKRQRKSEEPLQAEGHQDDVTTANEVKSGIGSCHPRQEKGRRRQTWTPSGTRVTCWHCAGGAFWAVVSVTVPLPPRPSGSTLSSTGLSAHGGVTPWLPNSACFSRSCTSWASK